MSANKILPDEAAAATTRRQPSTLASLIAGSAGGAAQVIVGQPLDVAKTRAQTAPVGKFKGMGDILVQTVRKEGPLALYKGLASPLIGVAAVNSLLFASNQAARRAISPYPDLTVPQIMTAGAVAGAAQSILASPVEMFKIKMQAQYAATGGKRLRDVVGDMYRQWGWKRGIMRGYWITVVREIPAYAGFYAGYEYTKRGFQSHFNTHTLPVWATLVAGSMGGLAYWTACYPLDVLKTRIQLAEAPPMGFNYIVDTFVKIYREEGARAFMRGLLPTYLRAVPAAASTFVGFEITMEWLQSHTSL